MMWVYGARPAVNRHAAVRCVTRRLDLDFDFGQQASLPVRIRSYQVPLQAGGQN